MAAKPKRHTGRAIGKGAGVIAVLSAAIVVLKRKS
jgi:hypothetical protein